MVSYKGGLTTLAYGCKIFRYKMRKCQNTISSMERTKELDNTNTQQRITVK